MPTQLQTIAKDLVERARLGDQNAMALIAEVRTSAQKGSERAKDAFRAITLHIQAYPVKAPPVAFGAETAVRLTTLAERGPVVGVVTLLLLPVGGKKAVEAGSFVLANGPPLDSSRINAIVDAIDNGKELFAYGVMNCCCTLAKVAKTLDNKGRCLLYAGQCVGKARTIQRVREGSAPVSLLSPDAGWELGE